MSGTAPESALVRPERRERDCERDGHEDDRDDEGDADAHGRTLPRRRADAPALAARAAFHVGGARRRAAGRRIPAVAAMLGPQRTLRCGRERSWTSRRATSPS